MIIVEEVATEELRSLQEKLSLESHVRKRAETFAAELYGENKQWKVCGKFALPT